MQEHLLMLVQVLRDNGEIRYASVIESVISERESARDAFLVSTQLWGGSGSIADQAGLVNGRRTDRTRKIQHALIQLGQEQIRVGKINVRTKMWVEVFKKWEDAGI